MKTFFRPQASTLSAVASVTSRLTLTTLTTLAVLAPMAHAQSPDASSVVFRTPEGLPVGEAVGSLPPSPMRGLMTPGQGLPQGARLMLSLQRGQLPADGKSAVRLRVEAFDAQGQRLTTAFKLLLETSLGRFQVPNTSGRGPAAVELAAVEAELRGGAVELVLMAPATPGTAILRASSGAVGVQGELEFLPDLRPLFAVGIVEGALHLGDVKRGAQSPAIVDAGFEQLLRSWNNRQGSVNEDANVTGRAAAFVKGAIRGDYLLTLRADTEGTRSKMFRDIDPNAFYPVVGDASVKEHDAQSRGKLFVRIDKGRSYALVGDFATQANNPNSKLGNYARALTGGQWVYQGQSVRISAFAAHQTTRAFVDEQPGRGISGPYAVGQANALANSERIEVITRNRLQPDVIVRRTPMQRYVDYDFEPFSGRILFNAPVPSVDEIGNPVTIRVQYEAEGAAERHWVAGGEVSARLGERVTVGVSAAKDQTAAAPYQLVGATAQLKLGDNTWVVVEGAQSQGTSLVNQTLPTTAAASTTREGRAARVELRHQSAKTQVQAQVAKTGAGFQNPTSDISSGRVEANVQAAHKLGERVTLRAGAVHTQDNSSGPSNGAGRTAGSVGASVDVTPRVRVDVAVNRALQDPQSAASGVNQIPPPTALGGIGFGVGPGGNLAGPLPATGVPGTALPTPATTALAGGDYTSVGVRVTGKVTDKVAVYAEAERTTDSKQRTAVGAEARVDDRTRAYVRHEMSNSVTGPYGLNTDGIDRKTTSLGVDTAVLGDAQLFAEYRIAGSAAGNDVARAVGLRRGWQLAPGLNLQTAVERQTTVVTSGLNEESTALSLGANYVAPANWKAAGRIDLRDSTYQREILNTVALDRQIGPRWTALVRNYFRASEGRNGALGSPQLAALGNTVQDRFQLGAAYRSVDGGRWDGLGRVEYRIDKTTDSASRLQDQDLQAVIASVHANARLHRTLTISGQLAAKSVEERVALGGMTPAGAWHGTLASGRVIWDFADRFDLSLYASAQRNANVQLYGVGAELGYRLVDNLWLAAGYNHGQYSDVELFSANATWNGVTMRMRWKFDERTLAFNDPRINRVMDDAAAGVAKLMRLWRE